MQRPKIIMKTISDHFDKALQSWGGTPVATCHCGRIHFVANGANMDEDELQGLEAKHKAEPARYIPGDGDSIGICTFNGVSHVWNCPCESLARAEEWIWAHREIITRYLRARLDAELKSATEQAERLKI
jgi:hypothetical protein